MTNSKTILTSILKGKNTQALEAFSEAVMEECLVHIDDLKLEVNAELFITEGPDWHVVSHYPNWHKKMAEKHGGHVETDDEHPDYKSSTIHLSGPNSHEKAHKILKDHVKDIHHHDFGGHNNTNKPTRSATSHNYGKDSRVFISTMKDKDGNKSAEIRRDKTAYTKNEYNKQNHHKLYNRLFGESFILINESGDSVRIDYDLIGDKHHNETSEQLKKASYEADGNYNRHQNEGVDKGVFNKQGGYKRDHPEAKAHKLRAKGLHNEAMKRMHEFHGALKNDPIYLHAHDAKYKSTDGNQ